MNTIQITIDQDSFEFSLLLQEQTLIYLETSPHKDDSGLLH